MAPLGSFTAEFRDISPRVRPYCSGLRKARLDPLFPACPSVYSTPIHGYTYTGVRCYGYWVHLYTRILRSGVRAKNASAACPQDRRHQSHARGRGTVSRRQRAPAPAGSRTCLLSLKSLSLSPLIAFANHKVTRVLNETHKAH